MTEDRKTLLPEGARFSRDLSRTVEYERYMRECLKSIVGGTPMETRAIEILKEAINYQWVAFEKILCERIGVSWSPLTATEHLLTELETFNRLKGRAEVTPPKEPTPPQKKVQQLISYAQVIAKPEDAARRVFSVTGQKTGKADALLREVDKAMESMNEHLRRLVDDVEKGRHKAGDSLNLKWMYQIRAQSVFEASTRPDLIQPIVEFFLNTLRASHVGTDYSTGIVTILFDPATVLMEEWHWLRINSMYAKLMEILPSEEEPPKLSWHYDIVSSRQIAPSEIPAFRKLFAIGDETHITPEETHRLLEQLTSLMRVVRSNMMVQLSQDGKIIYEQQAPLDISAISPDTSERFIGELMYVLSQLKYKFNTQTQARVLWLTFDVREILVTRMQADILNSIPTSKGV